VTDEKVQPLAGVKVLDFSHALAGPYCTMLLADLGADVAKVESPGGDQTRSWGPPFIEGESTYFMSVNRNKRSVVLDLKTEGGLSDAMALAMASDVVVENFKPGAMAKLGLDAARLQGMKPGLVYASISGYGQDQPTLVGYDQIAQGTSGMMSVNAPPGAGPTKVGIPIADITAGMFTAHAILASLFERDRSGKGRYIDVSLNDSLLALFTYQAGRLFATGESPKSDGNHHATISPYGTFATRDSFLNLAAATDGQFARLSEAIGAPELARDERFATNAKRQALRDELTREIERRLRTKTREEWLVVLERAGIPAGPIFDLAEAFSAPAAKRHQMKTEIDHPVAGRITQVGAPWKIDGASPPIRRPPPTLGQHTSELLREWLGGDRRHAPD